MATVAQRNLQRSIPQLEAASLLLVSAASKLIELRRSNLPAVFDVTLDDAVDALGDIEVKVLEVLVEARKIDA